MNKERLLELADILDKADAEHVARAEPLYCQAEFMHPCGTPACALGHWAASNPERWTVDNIDPRLTSSTGMGPFADARDEFDLTRLQCYALFDSNGCGGAKTAAQAAAYIRAFVARESGEQ